MVAERPAWPPRLPRVLHAAAQHFKRRCCGAASVPSSPGRHRAAGRRQSPRGPVPKAALRHDGERAPGPGAEGCRHGQVFPTGTIVRAFGVMHVRGPAPPVPEIHTAITAFADQNGTDIIGPARCAVRRAGPGQGRSARPAKFRYALPGCTPSVAAAPGASLQRRASCHPGRRRRRPTPRASRLRDDTRTSQSCPSPAGRAARVRMAQRRKRPRGRDAARPFAPCPWCCAAARPPPRCGAVA